MYEFRISNVTGDATVLEFTQDEVKLWDSLSDAENASLKKRGFKQVLEKLEGLVLK